LGILSYLLNIHFDYYVKSLSLSTNSPLIAACLSDGKVTVFNVELFKTTKKGAKQMPLFVVQQSMLNGKLVLSQTEDPMDTTTKKDSTGNDGVRTSKLEFAPPLIGLHRVAWLPSKSLPATFVTGGAAGLVCVYHCYKNKS
jgi:hypothetical protein